MRYIKTFESRFLSRLKNPFKKSFEDGEIEAKKILLSIKGKNFGDIKEVIVGITKKFSIDLKKSTIDSIISQSKHNIVDLKIKIKPHISNDTHTLDSIIIETGFLLNGEYSTFSRREPSALMFNADDSSIRKVNWINKVEDQEEVKNKNWACIITREFLVNKDEISKKIEDFIDDISTIGGFKRLGVDETIDSSIKLLDEKKKIEDFQSNIDDIKECLYDIIDISYNYNIFKNQGGGITCVFNIEGISGSTISHDTNVLQWVSLSDKVNTVLISILEAKGRIKDIVPDSDIKIGFSHNSFTIIINKVN